MTTPRSAAWRRGAAPWLVVAAFAVAGCATAEDDEATEPTPTMSSAEAAECEEGQAPCDDVDTSEAPPEVSGMCAEGEPDCDDMVQVPSSELPTALPTDGGGGAAGTCLAEATECADIPGAVPPGPPGGIDVEPREGLVQVRATPWTDVSPVDASQRVLRVTWSGGNVACDGLDRVEVEEHEDEVVVTVFTGLDPSADTCTLELVATSTTVELSAPLGPRSILDGSPGESAG